MGLSEHITRLASLDAKERDAAAEEIYIAGSILARRAARAWLQDAEFAAFVGTEPKVTVGLAVPRELFSRIREANGSPRLAEVPPDQDAEEFELHFPGLHFDVLTSKAPEGNGAIARYLSKFGAGIQQVEFLCSNVDGATQLLRERFGVTPIYPETRGGADGTRVNFFLVTTDKDKVLIELYEKKNA